MRAVQHGEGDSDDQIYVTCGLFTHGRVHGLIRASKDNDAVLRFLNDFNDFNKHRLGEDATWTSVSVTKNIGVNVHRYSNNHKGSLNCSTTVGQDSGGDLWLEEDIDEDQVREGHVVWKRDRQDQRAHGYLPGHGEHDEKGTANDPIVMIEIGGLEHHRDDGVEQDGDRTHDVERLLGPRGHRPHPVCVVNAGGHGKEVPIKMDGSGITFEDSVVKMVQSSLRPQSTPHDPTEASALQLVHRLYLIYCHDINDNKHAFLTMVDWATTYQVAIKLESEAKWQGGVTERQIGCFKGIWERVIHEMNIDEDEAELVATLV
ncbi:hypothetical protein AK812_SmicGene43427 [Symbiodinium microadriaticum]|uniref:Uncharacterized protein n=1 Tax=Symbiodinium microadriaticum TaxID=2951 RepID=A0A1Q9C117_SYMMI|nr:hypothetical protein AK812_SmicGene43427 [Symbiodinium microadriaticum]CAE7239059.1 unnamed protein product [Symbiodinium sp. KB8]